MGRKEIRKQERKRKTSNTIRGCIECAKDEVRKQGKTKTIKE